jgi:ADA HAT complex component 1
MQTIRCTPWSTESIDAKIMEKSKLHTSRPMSVAEMPSLMSHMKRKRTNSPELASTQHAHVVKKCKGANGDIKSHLIANVNADRAKVYGLASASSNPTESGENMSKVASAEALQARVKAQPSRRECAKSKVAKAQKLAIKTQSSSVATPNITMECDQSALQKAIEAQINLEILLKHNELRLIEQELAKCQIGLEQLRRCSLIPFPGTEGLSLDLSGGVGSALQPPAGHTEPQYAAPWGVTDGPYTRHYAKWLIPDAKFDPVSEHAFSQQQSQGYYGVGEGRTTRGSFAELGSTGKARTSRTSTGTLKLQALGENPTPAPKIDPLLHKRSTDGQWVRLYCAACGHSNFSNTQGFLNHCRIKHGQVFKSHDQAALSCGVPVDIDEAGAPLTTTATEPTATPTTAPAITFPAVSAPGVVHPLIRANPDVLAKDVHRDYNKPRDEVKPKQSAAGFSESPSNPYLSELLRQRGYNGNLQAMVDTASSKVDLDAVETSDDDLPDSADQTPIVAKPSPLARLPASSPVVTPASRSSLGRPANQRGHQNAPAHLPIPFSNSIHGSVHHMPGSPVELSPHTVESNPGLVSDDDDDDDEDGDDAHSQPDFIMHEDNVVVEDASDVEGVQERTGSRQGLNSCFEKGEGSRKHQTGSR